MRVRLPSARARNSLFFLGLFLIGLAGAAGLPDDGAGTPTMAGALAPTSTSSAAPCQPPG